MLPHEKYWRYPDNFLAYCESNGIVAFMFPAYSGYGGHEQGRMRELAAKLPARAEAYGPWVKRRDTFKRPLSIAAVSAIGYCSLPRKRCGQVNDQGGYLPARY